MKVLPKFPRRQEQLSRLSVTVHSSRRLHTKHRETYMTRKVFHVKNILYINRTNEFT